MIGPAQNRRIGIVATALVLIVGACGGIDTPEPGTQPVTSATATQTTGTTPAPTGDTTATSPTEETGAALEWLTVGELPVEANVPVSSTLTNIGRAWSVRTPNGFEFRVWPPPDADADTNDTLESELARAERGIQGDLLEVLLTEPGDTEWSLGYVRDSATSPGETTWVLQSVRTIGDVKYDCTSTSLSAEAYEFALGACRTLRAAE